MKKTIHIDTVQECWSLVNNITYATVPAWYGATYRDLKCSICIPKAHGVDKKYPLVIWICGGAFKVMDKDVWLPQWIEFAKKGCIVASVEYRTSNEAVFPAALCDIKAAIRYFKAHADQYSIDKDKVFVAGESAGGALASLAGTTGRASASLAGTTGGTSALLTGTSGAKEDFGYDVGAYLEYDSSVAGVIDYYGVVDMTVECVTSTGNDTYRVIEQFLGIEGNNNERKRSASAVCQVTAQTPPFLIFHGDQDTLVPIAQSESLYQKLCEAGVAAEYYVLEGEGHGADSFYQKEVMDIVWRFITQSVNRKV